MTDKNEQGYVTNCLIRSRGEILFTFTEECNIIPTLDGYAIIPMEEYKRLKEQDDQKISL